ncbi:MAG: DUF2905 domain-containing protein [Chloroflexi bacterium]|nr:DUF2905 domain-containing protein [Chloroflexota bacterium]
MEGIGKLLLLLGVSLALLGLLLVLAGKVPGIGRLPGDILVRRGGFTLYFPLATMLITSLALSLIVALVLRLFRG